MKSLHFRREDFLKIQKILEEFPEINNFDLIYDRIDGIGYTLDMSFDRTVTMKDNIITGRFNIPIAGVESL